jgi:hypothetical protein
MALFGQNMAMQYQRLDIWQNMKKATDVFERNYLLPPVPGFLTEFEMASVDYDGADPGWPYDPTPSERWSATWMFGGKVAAGTIFTGCVPPWPFWISCHVVDDDGPTGGAGTEEVTVPAGTYNAVHIQCTYIYAGFDDDGDARDDDADGYCNGQEVRDGTDPNDASINPGGTPEDHTNWIDEDGPDGVDNDGDGFTDEDQPGEDADGDGLWDEDGDDTHANDPGWDDDGDGRIDEDAAADGPPPAHGTRDLWWSEADGLIVKYITFNAPFFGTETAELTTKPTDPSIAHTPSYTFLFAAEAGGDPPDDQELYIWNGGGGTLNWSVSSDQTWLTLSPTSGTGAGTVTLSVDTTGMAAAAMPYTATITITDPLAVNDPQVSKVSLTLVAAP